MIDILLEAYYIAKHMVFNIKQEKKDIQKVAILSCFPVIKSFLLWFNL